VHQEKEIACLSNPVTIREIMCSDPPANVLKATESLDI
jgi:hypothetical protein